MDILSVPIKCVRSAVYNFKNKLIEESKRFNMKKRVITNRINVIALEEIMNNLLGIE